MQYFVSIENTTYFHWQAELLIESFKMQGMADDLVIGIAESDKGGPPIFTKNLTDHPHKFQHPNVGREKGLPSINKTYSALLALSNGILKQPFALIHPDMVLFKPITPIYKMEEFQVLYHPDNEMDEKTNKVRDDAKVRFGAEWIGLGSTMVFNDAPVTLLQRTMEIMESLKDHYGTDWNVERAAWLYSAIQHYTAGIKPIFAPQIMEMSLLHPHEQAGLIHYRHGMPPTWHKRQFTYETDFTLTENPNPHDVFESFNPTRVTDYVKKVVRSYRGE